MMQITKDDFTKLMLYAKDKLVANLKDGQIDKVGIVGTLQDLTLDDFLKETGTKKERAKRVENPDDRGFSKLWEVYPASPNFKFRGRSFKGSRALRSNYAECERLYLQSLANHKDLTPEMVMRALLRQKNLAYEESYETGQNKLNHWNGFEVWLRQEKFMAFISSDDDEEEVSDPAQEGKNGSYNNSNFA